MAGGEDEPGNLRGVVSAFSVNLHSATKTRLCFGVFLTFGMIDWAASGGSPTLANETFYSTCTSSQPGFHPYSYFLPFLIITQSRHHLIKHSTGQDGQLKTPVILHTGFSTEDTFEPRVCGVAAAEFVLHIV